MTASLRFSTFWRSEGFQVLAAVLETVVLFVVEGLLIESLPMDQPGDNITSGPRYCLKCEYDLRSVAENRCPECGRMFDPGNKRTFYTYRHSWVGKWFDFRGKSPWPEIEHLSNKDTSRVRNDPRFRRMQYMLVLGPLVMFISLTVLADVALDLSAVLLFLLKTFIAMLTYIAFRPWKGYIRRRLRDILADMNLRPSQCFECAYDLTDVADNHCPNCNAVITPGEGESK